MGIVVLQIAAEWAPLFESAPLSRRPNIRERSQTTADVADKTRSDNDDDVVVTLADVERLGTARMSTSARGYYQSGADQQQTLGENTSAYRRSVASKGPSSRPFHSRYSTRSLNVR
ncbi:hypothetical protein HPB52_004874 [Rhipicephalus sanguineus]|uniref:Uncharacterized protein n=1 Tax=Rhipicephalus sanguineus TaxID=34632 RepID=A0A9D4PU61_RHISA|nr:hypothetical protein HPB52_004874 [Rhipicephalus sanguineus]